MGKCILFCAGEFDRLAEVPAPDDFLIAADGGLRHLQKLDLQPHAVLGDFDSLGFAPQGAQVFPVKKDDTDSLLAIKLGLERGFREFVIYGGMDGPRLDHTLANFQALHFLKKQGAVGYLVGNAYLATVVSGETVSFDSDTEGILSLFCLGSDADGVTLQGLQYTMENGALTADFPLGVSNHFIGQPASVTVKSGCLLALWDRKNGFPQRSF